MLSPALDASIQTLDNSEVSGLRFYVAREQLGTPILLLHSINAAASSMEMAPLFEHFRASRPVYSLELPGFGQSDRLDQIYTPQLYAQAIADMAAAIPEGPPDIVALSLTCEFVARADRDHGLRYRSLSMISPTGFSARTPPGEVFSRRMEKVLGTPLLGRGLFAALTTRPSIRFFLGKAFVGETPARLIDYALETARQPGAHHAPFAFLSMRLFSADALASYAQLNQPALILYDQDPNIGFDRLPELLASQARVSVERISPSLGMPHWEQIDATVSALQEFWQSI
ncbi:MAG: alpha/beta hydrolase [Halieaceae bacterium]|jgi:pimeloyl-ACP methyl ester carboxylesterase|nr:alpha/beta hydrolase [Halieaceae bacterium]